MTKQEVNQATWSSSKEVENVDDYPQGFQYDMIPVAGILVFLLYALLFHEFISHFWGESNKKTNKGQNPGYRSVIWL